MVYFSHFFSLSSAPSPYPPLSPCPFSPSCEGATTPVLVGGKSSQLANHLTSQLKPTTATPTQPSSSSTATLASKASQAGPETSSASLPQGGGNASKQSSNKSAATQVLEASTLLQQQGGGEMGGATGTINSLTAELIAQCFLNLPNNTSVALGSGDNEVDGDEEGMESVAATTDAVVSAATVLAALGSLTQSEKHMHIQSCYSYMYNYMYLLKKFIDFRFRSFRH